MPLTKDQIEEIKSFIHLRGFVYKEVEIEVLDHICSHIEDTYEDGVSDSLSEHMRHILLNFPNEELNKITKGIKSQIDRLILRQMALHFKSFFIGHHMIFTIISILILLICHALVPSTSLPIFYRNMPLSLSILTICISWAMYFSKSYEEKYNSLIIERTSIIPSIAILAIGNAIGNFAQNMYLNENPYYFITYLIGCTLIIIIPITILKVHLWSANYFKLKFTAYQ